MLTHQGVFPIECNVLYPQVFDLPQAIFARDGIPIQAASLCSNEPGYQRLVKTGLSFFFQRTLMANSLALRTSQEMNPSLHPA